MQTMTTPQLQSVKKRQEDVLLINVLDENAFKQQHIPGSLNIPLSRPDFAAEVERRAGGKDKKIVVYCASTDCDASPKAAKRLDAAGFNHVFDYEAGVAGWAEASLPTERATA